MRPSLAVCGVLYNISPHLHASSALGAFLRSSPTARLSLLAYLCLLHVWVFYVMMTLSPEIHRPEDLEKHAPPGGQPG